MTRRNGQSLRRATRLPTAMLALVAALVAVGCTAPAAAPTAAPSAPTVAPSTTPTAAASATLSPAPVIAPTPASAPSPTRVAPSPTALLAALPSPAIGQIAMGRAVFAQSCSSCHGASGEGVIGPRLIGPGNNLAAYGDARAVYDYASRAMPQGAPGSLSQQQYLAVVAFVLSQNGYQLPQPLTVDNAAQVKLAR